MNRKGISCVMIVLLVITTVACAKTETTRYEMQSTDLFDTVTQMVGYSSNQETFDSESAFLYDNLLTYHKLSDIYHDYEGMANIKTINDNAGIQPVKVDQRIIDLLLFGKQAYVLTNGRTNIALGSVLRIWHEYREAGIANPMTAELPPEEALTEALRHTNLEDVIIDEEQQTVYLSDPDMSLDVGAIAKGYATEQVCQLAKEKGYDSWLLSVGGNVRALGAKPDGTRWSVAIQNPDLTDSAKPYLHLAEIEDQSFVTSGDYIRFYTVDGTKYHHIIDPKTGYPSTYCTSVTISCKDSGIADALSTALFCMSYEEGFALIESLDETEALWVFPDGSEKKSQGFDALLTP